MKHYITSMLVMFGCISITYADGVDTYIHPVAHIAGSYALTHAGEVICRKISGKSKTTCSIFSGIVATTIGLAIEAEQSNESGSAHAKSIGQNAAGTLLAIGMIHLDF